MSRSDTPPGLAELRRRIDRIDRSMIRLLAARQRSVRRIAEAKRRLDHIVDPAREAEVMANVVRSAMAFGADPSVASAVWRVLLECSVKQQIQSLRPPIDERQEPTGRTST
ncbi:chorismate mutase [Brevundimonas sp.]|uniref:chorismate mutase n=1 Tax=Brevundimonas sp. TaxID=1871086 RepID=UPI0025CCDF66|nr:chorismate mutase [Brevundimonas sp.]